MNRINWKRALGIWAASIGINLTILYLYVTYVMPYINEAAKGIAILMLGK